VGAPPGAEGGEAKIEDTATREQRRFNVGDSSQKKGERKKRGERAKTV